MDKNVLNDKELKRYFSSLEHKYKQSIVSEICNLIANGNLNKINLNLILKNHNIKKVEDLKESLIDIILNYIEQVLNDHIISETEKYNIEFIKILFKIKEGDFIKLRYNKILELLHLELNIIYEDNKITHEEALYKVELQDIFDLGFDQFEDFKRSIIK